MKTPAAISKLEEFHSLYVVCVFWKRLKAVGVLYRVSMSGEVKDPTGVNVNLLWAPSLMSQCRSIHDAA